MNREDGPYRMRDVDATELERRLLDAAAKEEPAPELRERMASAIGVYSGAPGGAGDGSGSGAAGTEAAAAAGTGSSTLLPWIAIGVVGLVVAGAVVGTRAWQNASRRERQTLAAEAAPAPPLAGAGTQPASPAATAPPDNVATPTPPRRNLATAGDLREQIAMVDAARAAVSAGAGDRALELLRQYREKFPAGSFRPEAAALRVEALIKLGRTSEARALAERFVSEFGQGPLADRVRRIVGPSRR